MYEMNTYEHRKKTEDKSKTNIWIYETHVHIVLRSQDLCVLKTKYFLAASVLSRNSNEDENKYKRKAGANTVAGQSGAIWAP